MKKEKLNALITVAVVFVIFVIGYVALRFEQTKLDYTVATENITEMSVEFDTTTTQAVSELDSTIVQATSATPSESDTAYQIDNTLTSTTITHEPSTSITTTQSTTVPTTQTEATDKVITNSTAEIPRSSLQYLTEDADAPVVYFTRDITAESMAEIYKALNWTPTGKVAVKLSIGEPPNSNYLRAELIKDVVSLVGGTIVECNTAYPGLRTLTATHYQVAEDHGYTAIAPVKILDEDGSVTLPVNGGKILSENYVGAAFTNYDSYVVLSHFKGHAMGGYGGAIKNISIGLASIKGKSWIHSGGKSKINPWGWNQERFCESMADAAKSVSDYLDSGKNIIYINVLNRISIDCDCVGNPEEPDIHDIGIMASTDPVAVDQACIDIVWVSEGSESFKKRVNDLNGLHTLESGEEIGLGKRNYRLVTLDE